MNLKLLGSDCSNGIKILKNLKKVERELECSFEINEISKRDCKKHVVMPTLILNDEIISEGRVISDRELKNILKPLLPQTS